MGILDEKSGVALGLIAMDPKKHKDLLDTLDGDARGIGQALVDGRSDDPVAEEAAKQLLSWANYPREKKSSAIPLAAARHRTKGPSV